MRPGALEKEQLMVRTPAEQRARKDRPPRFFLPSTSNLLPTPPTGQNRRKSAALGAGRVAPAVLQRLETGARTSQGKEKPKQSVQA